MTPLAEMLELGKYRLLLRSSMIYTLLGSMNRWGFCHPNAQEDVRDRSVFCCPTHKKAQDAHLYQHRVLPKLLEQTLAQEQVDGLT